MRAVRGLARDARFGLKLLDTVGPAIFEDDTIIMNVLIHLISYVQNAPTICVMNCSPV